MASANFAIIQKFFALTNVGKLDDAFTLLDDKAHWAIAQTVRGVSIPKAQLKDRMGPMWAAFEGPLQLTPISVIEQGDRLAVELKSHAITVLGKTYENKYVILFTVKDGKIMDAKEYNDSLHVTQVLVPAIEHAVAQSR